MKRMLFFAAFVCAFVSVFPCGVFPEDAPAREQDHAARTDLVSSAALTEEAWRALEQKEYDDALFHVEECIRRYATQALTQQATLTTFAPRGLENDHWALNDVAACHFIKGRIFLEKGEKEKAKESFRAIIDAYPNAQCWDPRGWFWKTAEGAKIQLENMDLGIDFGETSPISLTTKAWEYLGLQKFGEAEACVARCVELYGAQAVAMQENLKDFAPDGREYDYWALNDVATCLFIRGRALALQGKETEAKKVFQEIIDKYSFAQCWDPRGWFWKVAQGAKNEMDGIDLDFDFGDCSSETLAVKAWKALDKGRWRDIDILVRKCLDLYGERASQMQASLKDFAPEGKEYDFWALNDVATCLFIKAKAFQKSARPEIARKIYLSIMRDYPSAQCWDPRGWFWKVAQGAKNEIDAIDLGFDFGDFSSETLTVRAWKALDEGRHRDIEIFVRKCLELYKGRALSMQASMNDFSPKGREFDYWALNDVATSLFILGRSCYLQGKSREARKAFQDIIDNFSYAQCWDPRGWFWKPAEGAQDQILLMDTGIDFGDYTSMTLTVKAWNALDDKKYDEALAYCRKCITLYTPFAEDMQKNMDEFMPRDKAFDAWALNDVGTCLFIMGEAYMGKNEYGMALEAYTAVFEKYFYCQCWDPKGWFWKPAVVARARVHRIVNENIPR